MSAVFKQLDQTELTANYGICAAATLIIYDYLLTFQQERRLIWRSRWSHGKILFFFIRYSAFIVLVVFLIGNFTKPVSPVPCAVLMYMFVWLVLVVILCAGLVLTLRTWALWNRNIVCGTIIWVAWGSFAVLIVNFLVVTDLYLITDANLAFPNLAGCGAAMRPASANAVMKLCFSLVAYESLIFLMTVIRGLRYLYTTAPLILILYRDAFLASISFLGLTIADASLSSENTDPFYLPYMISVACYVIAPCRIILNLREATTYVDGWDLATTQMQNTGEDTAESDATGWS